MTQFQELISVFCDVITVVLSLEHSPDTNMSQYDSVVDGWIVHIIENIDTCLSAVFLQEVFESIDGRLLM